MAIGTETKAAFMKAGKVILFMMAAGGMGSLSVDWGKEYQVGHNPFMIVFAAIFVLLSVTLVAIGTWEWLAPMLRPAAHWLGLVEEDHTHTAPPPSGP